MSNVVPKVVIENPVLNSPIAEPARHSRFGDEEIVGEILPACRVRS